MAIFNKSLKNIANYIQFNHGNSISEAVGNITPANITLLDIFQPKPNPNKLGEFIPVSVIGHGISGKVILAKMAQLAESQLLE
jgi:hypothetical protein